MKIKATGVSSNCKFNTYSCQSTSIVTWGRIPGTTHATHNQEQRPQEVSLLIVSSKAQHPCHKMGYHKHATNIPGYTRIEAYAGHDTSVCAH